MTNEEIMKVVKPAVCSKLKSPSSAQFPDDLISIVGDDCQGYTVTGFVDSQNTYGAMVRSDFTVTVQANNGVPVVVYSSVGLKAGTQAGLNYVIITIFSIVVGAIIYGIIMSL